MDRRRGWREGTSRLREDREQGQRLAAVRKHGDGGEDSLELDAGAGVSVSLRRPPPGSRVVPSQELLQDQEPRSWLCPQRCLEAQCRS